MLKEVVEEIEKEQARMNEEIKESIGEMEAF